MSTIKPLNAQERAQILAQFELNANQLTDAKVKTVRVKMTLEEFAESSIKYVITGLTAGLMLGLVSTLVKNVFKERSGSNHEESKLDETADNVNSSKEKITDTKGNERPSRNLVNYKSGSSKPYTYSDEQIRIETENAEKLSKLRHILKHEGCKAAEEAASRVCIRGRTPTVEYDGSRLVIKLGEETVDKAYFKQLEWNIKHMVEYNKIIKKHPNQAHLLHADPLISPLPPIDWNQANEVSILPVKPLIPNPPELWAGGGFSGFSGIG